MLPVNSLSVKTSLVQSDCPPDLGEVRAAPLSERNPGRLTQG
jgi:hypothetical protein